MENEIENENRNIIIEENEERKIIFLFSFFYMLY